MQHVERPGGSHTALDGKKNAIIMQAVYLSIATKVLVVDLYTVQRAVPARKQKNQKQKKQQTKPHNHNQTKTNRTHRSGIATCNGNNMHDDILRVIMRKAIELEAKQ